MPGDKDVYVEYMIKRRPTLKSRLIQLSVWPAASCLAAVCMLFAAELVLFVLLGACWGAWQIFVRQNIEYEYILTNGELDVDRIIARRKRKRILTVDCRGFEILAPCHSSSAKEMDNQSIVSRVDASSSPKSENRWFAIFHGRENRRTILFFEPNQRILDSLKPFVSPQKFRRT